LWMVCVRAGASSESTLKSFTAGNSEVTSLKASARYISKINQYGRVLPGREMLLTLDTSFRVTDLQSEGWVRTRCSVWSLEQNRMIKFGI
jgi:hypothetical protein